MENSPDERPSSTDGGVTSDSTEPRCDAGTEGCRCLASGSCHVGLRCHLGRCESCAEGSAGCACKAGNACNTGLSCEKGVCQGCKGKAHCQCHDNGSCDTGLRCDVNSNGIQQCIECQKPGQANCNCEKDSDCSSSLLCVNKRCVQEADTKQIPKSPKCYSACEGDTQEQDGSKAKCHPLYRVKEGCEVGETCLQGSCISTQKVKSLGADEYPYCRTSAQCPAWQACLSGRCYSNCQADSDCSAGFACYAYVCRKQCKLSEKQCPANEVCRNVNSTEDEGFCMPLVSRDSASKPRTQTREVFALSVRDMSFTNQQPHGSFAILNQSQFPITVQVERRSDSLDSSSPLSWIKLDKCRSYNTDRTQCTAFEGKASNTNPFVLVVPGNQSVIVKVQDVGKAPQSPGAYRGLLAVKSSQVELALTLGFRRSGSGRWQGKVYSFGNFDDTNIDKLLTTSASITSFRNAFLRRWLNFKQKTLSYEKFSAILQSIQNETWRKESVAKACQKAHSQQNTDEIVCYPFSSSVGYEILSYSKREAPVPSGVASLDFAINVKEQGNTWIGKVDSQIAMQYPGDPQIKIEFHGISSQSSRVALKSLQAIVDVGGRYSVSQKESCSNPSDFQRTVIPWLPLDFVGTSSPTTQGLMRERYECRQKTAPRGVPGSASSKERLAIEQYNLSLSGANPIPNGRPLRRTLELVDGVLYENKVFLAIVRERFVSPFAGQSGSSALSKDWVRYGYLWLKRTDEAFTEADTQSVAPSICKTNSDCGNGEACNSGACLPPLQQRQVSCSPALVQKATQSFINNSQVVPTWSSSQLNDLVWVLIYGQTSKNLAMKDLIQRKVTKGYAEYSYQDTSTQKTHYIHYLCEDTRQFNGGLPSDPKDCPEGSKVIFFELANVQEITLRKDACQVTQTCDQRLQQLRSSLGFREDVPYRCEGSSTSFCDSANRKDMREGKLFFPPSNGQEKLSSFKPLRDSVRHAFRYYFKFRSRDGKNFGFAPVVCSSKSGSQTPYCYDAQEVEQLQQRMDCLEFLYNNSQAYNKLNSTVRGVLKQTLTQAFSYRNTKLSTGTLYTELGFETLNAQLRVMLGDEAYVKALANRYNLASQTLIGFEGDKLEPNGVKLSGVLGAEMYQLYLSVHYYQSVLDRFYAQTGILASSFRSSSTAFLNGSSVTSYIRKLLLAATRKARSWSQIAQAYHKINRPDLAKLVLERAYVSSYIEQMVLTRLLHAMANVLDNKMLPALRNDIENIVVTYNAALLQMQDSYQKVQRKLDYFGFPSNYIPFLAVTGTAATHNTTNSFQLALEFAKQKLSAAKEKEDLALYSKRSFDTNTAQFQSELAKIQTSYNEQLIQICGELKDGEASVPAIPRNAHLLPSESRAANPCGRVKGSLLFEAYTQLKKLALNVPQLAKQRENVLRKINDEKTRIRTTCNTQYELSKLVWKYRTSVKNLRMASAESNLIQQSIMRSATGAIQLVLGHECEELFGGAFKGFSHCKFQGASILTQLMILASREYKVAKLSLAQLDTRDELQTMQNQFAQRELNLACNICKGSCSDGVARISSQAYLSRLALELQTFKLRAIGAQMNIRMAYGQIQSLLQQANRLIQEQEETISMLKQTVAAAQDPNQRIYKNDAVISAERTFNDALREAYRTTLIYEYYTGQSYARKSNLFLVRMISRGDINLETYMSRLEQAFRDFEENNGKPALRVAVVSLLDDIIKPPRTDADGNVVGNQARVRTMRKALVNRANYNESGYLSFSFSLSVNKESKFVSPLTFNHKIAFVEAEIEVSSAVDEIGRIYLRQSGTGVVRNKDDSFTYYSLPQRTAVINTFFNGFKGFDSSTYQNYRLADRPLGNTQWELIFNQASETSNQDIDLSAITDIRLYIYYKDFSKP